ncbi:MAG: type II toxin-antitoxin system RelE/ParE family toxin [Methylococcaceae bacterium]|nr:type II toxin-antitoxin system RelE/ParE family toxin [Methylococcaceae bacterium]
MIELREYITDDGVSPFHRWLYKLKNREARARIRIRLDRVARGNLGDYKLLSNGLYELRFTIGSGYRIYFGRDGERIILLLCGGDKSTQTKDIEHARLYLDDYMRKMT